MSRKRAKRYKVQRAKPVQAIARIEPPRTQQSLVLCDATLFERALTQWQFGDWSSLIKIEQTTLHNHPERGKLALLIAAAHLQSGSQNLAAQHIRLAKDWGCSAKLILRILVAGVHNSLGRAAVLAANISYAITQFELALTVGSPGSGCRLLVKARAAEQFSQINRQIKSHGDVGVVLKSQDLSLTQSDGNDVAVVVSKLMAMLDAQFKKQLDEVVRIRQSLEEAARRAALNTAKQIEAFLNIQNYPNNGDLVGDMHGWSISPDFGLTLIQLLETNIYSVVIEFGSGTSTVLIAKALGRGATILKQDSTSTIQVAFEHLEKFHARTFALLDRAAVAHAVRLELAPLVPYLAPNGETYTYYDCQAVIRELAIARKGKKDKILLVVDGPPGSVGKHSRYPAVPIVTCSFADAEIAILLDDYLRSDEQEIAALWKTDLEQLGFTVESSEISLEKKACFISASKFPPGEFVHDEQPRCP